MHTGGKVDDIAGLRHDELYLQVALIRVVGRLIRIRRARDDG
jgi:hypothetical protein